MAPGRGAPSRRVRSAAKRAAAPESPVPIRFGTSGWRGILAEEITAPRVRAAAWAVGRWLVEERHHPRVLVAHDTRFLGERLAATAARILAGCGARPVPVLGPVPTPVVARALYRGRAAAGLIFTASHNPPEYQGVKLLVEHGAAASPGQTRRIEALASRALTATDLPEASVRRRPLDLVAPYLDDVLAQLDRPALRRSGIRVAYDAFHGAGAGVLDAALERAGLRVALLRGAPDARFGGQPPDPSPPRLVALAHAVRALRGRRLGLATDGDADRYAVVDAGGEVLAESDALALLIDHLARTGRVRRGVAISLATGSLVERVAGDHGLPVRRFPIGFKHLARALREGEADVAGEESGGFAWAPFGLDKDGILAGCLIAELAAHTRTPLRARLRALQRRHGRRASGRVAVASTDGMRTRLERLAARPPARCDGVRVEEVDCTDGVRLALRDGFLMLRASGTEPVVRIYAEAPGRRRLARRLALGRRLLGARRVDDSRGSG